MSFRLNHTDSPNNICKFKRETENFNITLFNKSTAIDNMSTFLKSDDDNISCLDTGLRRYDEYWIFEIRFIFYVFAKHFVCL